MRVVVAIFEQLVPISGGGTPRTTHIIRSLVRRGHEVYVAAGFATSGEDARRELGCAGVLRLPNVSRLDPRKMLKYLFVYPWNVLQTALYVWRTKPDLVISHNTVAGYAAVLGKRLAGRAVTVLDLTDLLFEYLDSYSKRWIRAVLSIGRWLERHTIRHSDHIVTISQAMRAILIADHQVTPEKMHVVHDGVDTEVFNVQDASALRRELSPSAKHVCVLHGVIDPQDGPEVLAQAAPYVLERFADTHFWCVGDGAAVPDLRNMVRQLGIEDRFVFTGWLRQGQVPKYINASDVGIVVLPDVLSARGRVTLKEFEYWACSKPAVLPRLPALQEIIPEGEGSLFFVPGDAHDLAAKICVLLADDELRRTMGRRGLAMVLDRFEWRVLADELVSLCEKFTQVPTPGQSGSGGRE